MTFCPACKRYIGHVNSCPYCDIDIPKCLPEKLLPPLVLTISVIGLFILWASWPIAPVQHDLEAEGILAHAAAVCLPQLTTVLLPHAYWLAWALMLWLASAEPVTTIGIAPTGGRAAWHTIRPIAMATTILMLSGALGLRLAEAALLLTTIPDIGIGILWFHSVLMIVTAIAIAALPRLYNIRRRHLLGTFLLPIAMGGFGN